MPVMAATSRADEHGGVDQPVIARLLGNSAFRHIAPPNSCWVLVVCLRQGHTCTRFARRYMQVQVLP